MVTSRTTQSLHTSEIHSETEKRKRRIFDDMTQKKLGDSMSKPKTPDTPDHDPYSTSVNPDSIQFPDDDDLVMHDGTTIFQKPITD